MAEKEKEKEQAAEEEVEEGKKKKKKKKRPLLKWIIIGVMVLIIAGAGLTGWMYFSKKDATKEGAATEEPPPPAIGAVWRMDSFIVNLRDERGRERYLKVVVQLELSDEKVVPELELLKPKLRDNVLDLLAEKTYKDIISHGGRQRLRGEIAMRLNSYLRNGRIVEVYFTEFVIQ
ncbi:MAG: flagellar basal body-associated FliL family protein [Proteobacteria bacterium]|nr:flagellar basal body-associated FliL family protein [Pseudomonadota bacterium]